MQEQQRLVLVGRSARTPDCARQVNHFDSSSDDESTRLSTQQVRTTEHGRGFLPPSTFVFGTMLMREMLHRLQTQGYAQKETGAVHCTIFARYLRQLVDCLSPLLDVDFDKFSGDCQKVWLQWPEIRGGVVNRAIPPVKITCVERILMTLEDAGSSHLGAAYAAIMFVCIMLSLVLVVVQSLEEICPPSDGERHCFPRLNFLCIVMFSFDYFARLACSPWSRHAIFDREWHLTTAVPDLLDNSGALVGQMMTPPQRFCRFLVKPMNIIDALAIAPFWLTFFFRNLLPFPLAFLRTLRLLRFLRIMKIGKFDSTVVVLGTTLAKSVDSIQVLLIYVLLMSLVFGAILNQTERIGQEEPKPPFDTVPASSWWVFARILWMRHSSPWSKGYPSTLLGSLVNIVYLVLKNIIWALPFGQIRQIFDKTWKETQEMQEIRRSVELEDAAAMDTLWIENGKAAAIEIEVWQVGDAASLAERAMVPVPILESTASTAIVQVNLSGGNMSPWFGRPQLEVEVSWRPTQVEDGHSRGELEIVPLRGQRFVSNKPTSQWRCLVKVPVHLFGHDSLQSWTSRNSTSGQKPRWDPDSGGGCFSIAWTRHGGETIRKEPSREQTDASMEALLQKTLDVLAKRDSKIDELSKRTARIDQHTAYLEHALLERK